MLRTLINPASLIGDRLGVPDPLLDKIAPRKQEARQKAARDKPVRPARLSPSLLAGRTQGPESLLNFNR